MTRVAAANEIMTAAQERYQKYATHENAQEVIRTKIEKKPSMSY